MLPRSACVVLVPYFDRIEPETNRTLQELSERGYAVRTLRGCSQIDMARSILATQALKDGYQELMWIDSDVTFNPYDVSRLRSYNLPITAGLYVKKGKPEFAGRFLGNEPVTFGKGGKLVEMAAVGFGFVHVRSAVFAKMAALTAMPSCSGGLHPDEPITPFFMPMMVQEKGQWFYLSEDASFCQRARWAGFSIIADTTIKLGHGVGPYKWTWDDIPPRQTYETFRVEFDLAGGEKFERVCA